MPLHALLAVAALAGAASLSSRAQAGSRARMTPAQAAAHKARLVELLRAGDWRDALDLNKAEGKRKLDLRGARLSGARLSGADLYNANLSSAWLLHANLTNTNLADANLTGAILDGARLPEGFLSPSTRVDAVPWTGTPSGWRAIASPRGARFLPLLGI